MGDELHPFRALVPMDQPDADNLAAAIPEMLDRVPSTADWSTLTIRLQPAGGLVGLDLPEWMPVLTLEVQA